MKRKVHVVPHSHWDREWYFTTSRSKVYLMKDLKDVLDTLESKKVHNGIFLMALVCCKHIPAPLQLPIQL